MHDNDWRRVAAWLTGPVPGGKPIWYQKHMTHHLLAGMDLGWVHQLTNVFLIRDPALVVASYVKSRATVVADDIGLLQQERLFDEVAQGLGRAPLVIDVRNQFRDNPGIMDGTSRPNYARTVDLVTKAAMEQLKEMFA